MPRHCAALPGASNELLGSGTAELATALLQRLGAAIPGPRSARPDGAGPRHVAVLHTPSPYAPRPVTPRSALQRLSEVRPRVPSRPVLAAATVTALGAAAAVTATGQFGAVAPADATQTLSLAGTSSATDAQPAAGSAATAIAPAAAAAPSVTGTLPDLPTVKVSTIVGDATSTAQKLATKALKARSAATAAAAAAAVAKIVPDHVPVPTPDESAPKASKGSGVGGAALSAAMNKIGKPYSWGAVGPNAFDCSGLVQWAFKQAGVSLPRTSAAQSSAGTSVSKSQLRPGDLVFFYSPVSHVGIYVGGGKILNASQSGEPVKISNMEYMPFHNARRL